ncbi:hypothetical protein OG607_37655 [Streptomyces sp. NBC_01537]|uniref:hypothetical protein n=1 Tax=Streptomyces sp. NBC_01537 TaxID=2903896 RepID=UPI0038689A25
MVNLIVSLALFYILFKIPFCPGAPGSCCGVLEVDFAPIWFPLEFLPPHVPRRGEI